jgi:hypothetical protein
MNSQYKRSKVGFPIRRSSDHSSFAAPQGLSQRTTSFIASQRQGIHQMLFRHLIALMIHARRKAIGNTPNPAAVDQKDRSWIAPGTCLPNTTGLNSRPFERPKLVSGPKPQPVMFPLHDVKHPQGPKGPPTNPQIFPDAPAAGKASPLVEPDGIEPTTSSLQSSRSPN